jgi:hypothetical protein
MMAQIQGRDKFSYDVDSDPLLQQALASAMSSGKTAMQDTIGQASALTGGYGSTYATAAGNQAYNAFLQDAYDNLPQYYQMAMDAYQREGDELYRQYGMLVDADATEYGRNITAYDAMSQYRNQLYNEDYQMHRDSKADALSLANLQLSEHGQLVSDAVNNYKINADYENTLYNREYQSWLDSVNNAWKQMDFERGVYEADRNYDRGVYEADRKYETDIFEDDRNFEEKQRQYNDSQYWSNFWKNQDQANWEKKFNSSGSDNTTNDKPRTGFKFDSTEKANIRNIYNGAYDEAIKAGASVDDANKQAATVLENYLTENGITNLNSAEEDIIVQIVESDAKYYELDGKHYTEDELWEALKKKFPKARPEGLSLIHKEIISGKI